MGYSGWNEIFVALKIIQEAHHKDARMNNEQPYLIHQFEIISDYLKKYPQKNINLHDILILLLHDTIEDHPEYWKQILEQFWIGVFRDVLILSTGWISFIYREEILEHLNSSELFGINFRNSTLGEPLHDIFHILDPRPPLRKLNTASRYMDKSLASEKITIERAIKYYSRILLKIDPNDQTMDSNKEYIALCHYVYMKPRDIHRKTQDMLHNMKDMEEVEKRKPGYIAKRHIKAYILLVKMKNYWMQDVMAELLWAFQEAGYPLNQAVIENRMQDALLDLGGSIWR